ncbi:YIP1 family protein [Desulfobaculum bizertense]|uniref:MJ0042 family finger-like domain-containing protein n=1 Tax=Desulfobaculum bizertense DSM 18034 TaxID=1121442 RepID=A0A1T4VW86_9BACT|nr:YIP1 family protein [Desulfobaculum bizertense]UIJ36763.1 zinc-ribbon domain-containing protein [Desulfobaculum bizertense]SKA69207.1 MJ0042 family finger-like domain-containing protein [Desulfobaculum bizertense DSM 18034]
MKITCPHCDYAREVPDDKIPTKSVRATCPKCGKKFQFRAPEFSFDDELKQNETPQAPAEGVKTVKISLSEEEVAADEHSVAKKQQEHEDVEDELNPSKPQSMQETEEIWDRLNSMDGEEDENRAYRERWQEQQEFRPRESSTQASSSVPFENLEEHGFFNGLIETIKKVSKTPTEFFSKMPLAGGRKMPLIFYILLGEFSALCQTIWQVLGSILGINVLVALGPQPAGNSEPGPESFAILLVLPILLFLFSHISSGILHGTIRLLHKKNQPYEATYRVICYSCAPTVLSVFPVIGAIVGSVWSLVLTYKGLKKVHGMSVGKTISVLLLPFLALMILSMIVSFLIAMWFAVNTGSI